MELINKHSVTRSEMTDTVSGET